MELLNQGILYKTRSTINIIFYFFNYNSVIFSVKTNMRDFKYSEPFFLLHISSEISKNFYFWPLDYLIILITLSYSTIACWRKLTIIYFFYKSSSDI